MAKKFDVLIIGGGAAGLTAAVFSARAGRSAAIICPDKPGHKLSITGKGRCNLTNDSDNQTIMNNLPRGGRFMFSALNGFSSADTMAFFEELGVPLKTERGRRVFPVSDRAWDVVDALKRELVRLNVPIIAERAVQIITQTGENDLTEGLCAPHTLAQGEGSGAARPPLCGGQAAACGGASPKRSFGGAAPDVSPSSAVGEEGRPSVRGVKTDKGVYYADKVIVATGGLSYPATGSTGDGYKLAKALGHKITPLKGSLVPMETAESCIEAAGLTLKNVTLTLTDGKRAKPLFKELGEVSFTAFGISGPLTLSASSYVDDTAKNRYLAELDLKPGLDENKLDLRLQRDFAEGGKNTLEQALRKLMPAQLIPLFLERVSIPADKRAGEISKAQRQELVALFKRFPLTIKRLRPVEEAIITDGGIELKEVNPKTMESRLVDGLFFAGEILDVTGFTGGFNLQVAFSTAFAAAKG